MNTESIYRIGNRYYHAKLGQLIASHVPAGKKVLEIGCGSGDLLHRVEPSAGVGIDSSRDAIETAKKRFPNLRFSCDNAETLHENDRFDYVILSDLLGELQDVWQAVHELHKVTDEQTRLILTYINYLWEPVLRLINWIRRKKPCQDQNWLSPLDVEQVLHLNGYEIIKKGHHLLMPVYLPLLSNLVNRYGVLLPLLKHLSLVHYAIAREIPSRATPPSFSVSVIVPCRNERGNIANAVARIPDLGSRTEIIFVDGESTDGTVEEIEEMILRYRGVKNIRLIHQTSPISKPLPSPDPSGTPSDRMLRLGKADAVRKGFGAATGEVLMILDADLTVPPEDLPKFYDALVSGRGEFIIGNRLVYQMEDQAMRTLNLLANKFFSRVFTWILGQPIRDTLCGTKVLFRRDYEEISRHRDFFGTLDPFGDFELLFGAAKLNLKIVEVPVRYRSRTYGNTKIERFRHGLLLLRMAWVGLKKLKLSV